MRNLIIAIDGPVGSGKSTVARGVAELLGYTYLDSGAMYRALALKAIRRGVSLSDVAALETLARETHIDLERGPDGQRVLLDGEDVTQGIRTAEVSQAASHVALIPGVRQVLVDEQRRAGSRGGVVMEGRDIGTVVFPDADVKIFLDAAAEVRGLRRYDQLDATASAEVQPEDVIQELRARDARDRNRADSPLKAADDAVILDSTHLTLDEVVAQAEAIVQEKLGLGVTASR